MLRLFLIGICLLTTMPRAKAMDELELSAAYQAVHTEGLLRAVDIALVGIADTFSQTGTNGINDLLVHESLNRLIKRVPGLRAVIVTDQNGILRHDSFRYPTQNIDLSKRAYIRETALQGNRDLRIGKPLKNKFATFSSLPLSRSFIGPLEGTRGVVTAFVLPDELFKRERFCKYCYAALYTQNGEELVAYPALAGLTLPKMSDIKNSARQNKAITYAYKGFRMKSVWMDIPAYNLTMVYHQALDTKVETQ